MVSYSIGIAYMRAVISRSLPCNRHLIQVYTDTWQNIDDVQISYLDYISSAVLCFILSLENVIFYFD